MAITTCTETGVVNGPCASYRTTYAGAVLSAYEVNGYDDSDFVAIVWDTDLAAPKTVTYATTRGWTYHNGATIDATPEVIAEAERWLVAALTSQYIAAAETAARTPQPGRTVKSLTTRGKARGVTGIVKWYGLDQYRSSRSQDAYRVGVAVDGHDRLVYAAADRVEVLDPPTVDIAEITRRARADARRHNWRSAMTAPVYSRA